MKVDYIQTSFAGGEFGASLFGRTDLEQYNSACAIVENMLIRPYGSVISSAGTEFITACSMSTTRTRLVPFTFNRTDAYILEMGVGYMRFLTQDGLVVSTGTTPFNVSTPYTEAELNEIQFTQLNDLIWFFHTNHPTRRLVRYSANYWEFEEYAWFATPYMDDNSDELAFMSASASSGTGVTVTTSTNVFVLSNGTTKGHWNTQWKMGGVLTESTTGLEVQGFFLITDVVTPSSATVTIIRNLTLPANESTLEWAESAWSDINGYPASGTFFEQRLYVARTDQEPQKIWGSQPFIYDDMSVNSASDSDAINIQIASNESNEIQWLVSGASLIAGTFGGEFIISGNNAPITPTNVSAKPQTSWGSERLVPKRIGNYFYYIQRYGRKLRELFYNWDLDSYKSMDRTILSPDVLGKGVVEMAYQQNPDTMLWCVKTDGTIAVMTREIDQELTAWSRINSGDDMFESICAIPSPTELYDQIWVVVKRTIVSNSTTYIKRYIEVFKSHEIPDRQDLGWYLHSALRYNAYDESAGLGTKSLSTISISATTGTGVVVTTSAIYFEANDVGQRIRFIDPVDGTTVGEIKIKSYGTTTLVEGDIVYDLDALSYDAGSWGVSVSELSGLEHLEGTTIKVLADGGVDRPAKVVSNGTISLAYNYFVVLVGKPYTQKLQTLPPEAGSQRGTSQGKIQRISEVAFKVNRSYKGFKVGGTEELAEKVNFRDPSTLMGTPEALFTGILANITFRDDYRYGSRVTIINEDPLPIELLSIISTIDTNDK